MNLLKKLLRPLRKEKTPIPVHKMKLSIGIQSFAKLIRDNFIYVDKTEYIYTMIERGTNYFISRPKRFGKSLLISTLSEIFNGNKELFKGCWIYKKIRWKKYPVIHIDFSEIAYHQSDLPEAVESYLRTIAAKSSVTLQKTNIKEMFTELIEKMSTAEAKPVVILIDEYDKPIVDYIEEYEKADRNRQFLKDFYSVLKNQDKNIKFLFITGITRFTRVSLFTDLNHLNDITMDPRYSRLLGYTQEEIEHYFQPYIEEWLNKENGGKDKLFNQMKDYYNGYSWDGETFLYNPFSIVNFFEKFIFGNYWYAVATPTFLINMLRKSDLKISRLENIHVNRHFFDKFDIENIDDIALMHQTGCLTIKGREEDNFSLSYPNREVRESFLQDLIVSYSSITETQIEEIKNPIKNALNQKNLPLFIQSIQTLFSTIPYNIIISNREAYFHSIFYMILKLCRVNISCEVPTNLGRIDALIQTDNYIYILEFKMGSADTALKQIEEKKYYEPYLEQKKKIVLVGIGIGEHERNILNFRHYEYTARIPGQKENQFNSPLLEDKPAELDAYADKITKITGLDFGYPVIYKNGFPAARPGNGDIPDREDKK